MYQSLSLTLFTFAKTAWIHIRPEWNSGKNVSSILKFVHAIESTQSVVQRPMRTIKWVFSIYLNEGPMRGSRSDPNGIQERMFRQFKHSGMR